MKSLKLKITVVLVITGVIYGFVSAIYNQNPYYPAVGSKVESREQMFKAWHWEPSPVWFPSYLLCKMAQNTEGNWAGITCTKSGFLFRSQIERILYFIGSTFIGMAFSIILGIGIRKLIIKMKNYKLINKRNVII